IRDFHVTGVQTCALPILALQVAGRVHKLALSLRPGAVVGDFDAALLAAPRVVEIEVGARVVDDACAIGTGKADEIIQAVRVTARSEERRVGKECKSGRWA